MSQYWNTIKQNPKATNTNDLLLQIKAEASTSTKNTTITFGTSGWRGVIGEVFSVYNLSLTVQAIVEMMKTDVFLKDTGIASFAEVQKKGLLIGRDTRFMGEDFVKAASEVCAANQVNVYVIDRPAVTPDLSLTVVEKGFAGSINITPSHNPFEYNGIKFNPADGGTADSKLTNIIEEQAVKLASSKAIAKYDAKLHAQYIHSFEALTIYKKELTERKVIDFDLINQNFTPQNITFIVDNVHGASYGYLENILEKLKFSALRSNRDYLFGGSKPEPSAENMQLLTGELAKHNTPLQLGVILDPDGDRVRFTDGEHDIDMNAFGAIAFHYLATVRNFKGGVAKSVATSNLVNIIAQGLGRPVFETAVGFKNFRSYLKNNEVVCAFEESDGITLQNHTLEKDGVIGTLLALEITLRTEQPLGAYLTKLQKEYGFFYPKRFSAPIEAEQKLTLHSSLSKYKVGDKIKDLQIAEIITIDGFKFVFTDQSWLMIRPSGTEPKVRIYVEGRKEEEAEMLFELAKSMI